jgi:DNA-binding PadR family transcriptional regulator
MYSKELLKGTLSAIILKLLADHDRMYGYQIAQKVKDVSGDKIRIKEGSLYPALHKLKEDGLVDIETITIGKRVRRYYTLTPEGLRIQKDKVAEIEDFIATLKKIIS